MENREALLQTLQQYKELGIADQLNYDKFNLYALITHSTAMEGSKLTEIEIQLLFNEKIMPKGKSIEDQLMNLDLKEAYSTAMEYALSHKNLTVELLNQLCAEVMLHTGKLYECPLGVFDASKGDIRLMNVTAGVGGSSYLNYRMVPESMRSFCEQINERRKELLLNRNVYDMYMLSFDAYYLLASIHPWGDGNGRMSRLVMNALQYEFGLIPSRVMKENKAECLAAWERARETDSPNPFREFLLEEHIKNLKDEIAKYLKDNHFNPLGPLSEPQKQNSEPHNLFSEPQRGPQGETQKNLKNEPQENNSEPQDKEPYEPQAGSVETLVIEAIHKNNKITREELANLTGTSLSTIKRRLKNMSHLIEYVGSGYSGHWEIKSDLTTKE